MKPALIIVLVIVAGFIGAFMVLRSHISIAEHGMLDGLSQRLAKLKLRDSDPTAFLGFCTRDEDALYFVHEHGTFFLDYELSTPQKTGNAGAFRKTTADLGFTVIDTTYGKFPVLRVDVGNAEAHAAEIGLAFTQRLFGHDQKTVFEFLP
jgi:hypothetical protein